MTHFLLAYYNTSWKKNTIQTILIVKYIPIHTVEKTKPKA